MPITKTPSEFKLSVEEQRFFLAREFDSYKVIKKHGDIFLLQDKRTQKHKILKRFHSDAEDKAKRETEIKAAIDQEQYAQLLYNLLIPEHIPPTILKKHCATLSDTTEVYEEFALNSHEAILAVFLDDTKVDQHYILALYVILDHLAYPNNPYSLDRLEDAIFNENDSEKNTIPKIIVLLVLMLPNHFIIQYTRTKDHWVDETGLKCHPEILPTMDWAYQISMDIATLRILLMQNELFREFLDKPETGELLFQYYQKLADTLSGKAEKSLLYTTKEQIIEKIYSITHDKFRLIETQPNTRDENYNPPEIKVVTQTTIENTTAEIDPPPSLPIEIVVHTTDLAVNGDPSEESETKEDLLPPAEDIVNPENPASTPPHEKSENPDGQEEEDENSLQARFTRELKCRINTDPEFAALIIGDIPPDILSHQESPSISSTRDSPKTVPPEPSKEPHYFLRYKKGLGLGLGGGASLTLLFALIVGLRVIDVASFGMSLPLTIFFTGLILMSMGALIGAQTQQTLQTSTDDSNLPPENKPKLRFESSTSHIYAKAENLHPPSPSNIVSQVAPLPGVYSPAKPRSILSTPGSKTRTPGSKTRTPGVHFEKKIADAQKQSNGLTQ